MKETKQSVDINPVVVLRDILASWLEIERLVIATKAQRHKGPRAQSSHVRSLRNKSSPLAKTPPLTIDYCN